MNTTDNKTSNKYIFDSESSEELVRLMNQDRFVTMSMGGPFAGLPPLPEEAQVLDLGCGPGGWVLDVAFQQPQFEVAGIDCSQGMVDYANARARSQMLSNASFGVMDITNHPLDFADDSFDLVNARFLFGVLKREDWLPFIAECTRLLRPDGIIQLTEADTMGETLSAPLARLNELATLLFWKAGYGFSPNGRSFSMTPGLLHMLRQTGYDDIHVASSEMNASADTPFWANYYRNMEMIFLQMKPLLRRFELIGDTEFEQIYQQALAEMCAQDFAATGHVTSIWARKKGCTEVQNGNANIWCRGAIH
jgi:ubiquinone/menaquinone biosynthesis C-methylase UbiE